MVKDIAKLTGPILAEAPGYRMEFGGQFESAAEANRLLLAVGAAVVVLGPEAMGPSGGWNAPIAAVPPADGGVVRRVGTAAAPLPAPASAQSLVLDGQVIRDARLDAYFEAHRGAFGPGASAMPGGALRSVEILVPQR